MDAGYYALFPGGEQDRHIKDINGAVAIEVAFDTSADGAPVGQQQRHVEDVDRPVVVDIGGGGRGGSCWIELRSGDDLLGCSGARPQELDTGVGDVFEVL